MVATLKKIFGMFSHFLLIFLIQGTNAYLKPTLSCYYCATILTDPIKPISPVIKVELWLLLHQDLKRLGQKGQEMLLKKK